MPKEVNSYPRVGEGGLYMCVKKEKKAFGNDLTKTNLQTLMKEH